MDPTSVVQQAYEAFGRQDVPAILKLVAEEVDESLDAVVVEVAQERAFEHAVPEVLRHVRRGDPHIRL